MAVKKTKKIPKKTTSKKVEKEKIVEEIKVEAALDSTDETIIAEDLKDIVEQDTPIDKEYLDAIVENKATIGVDVKVMNGDQSVIAPTDEIEKEAMENTFKENKINKRISNIIGYSWNGMEMDTY